MLLSIALDGDQIGWQCEKQSSEGVRLVYTARICQDKS